MAAAPTDLLDELVDVRGRDVLDIGCGGGWVARHLAQRGARVVGVDPLASAVERARSEDPEGLARYVEGAAEALPFADGSFDVVVFFNSLHHVPEDSMATALGEAARVLRAGGTVFVQEPAARGEMFELVRPVDDETRVRAAAQAALASAADLGLVPRAHREAPVSVRFAGFDALRQMVVSVDPARAAQLHEHEQHLRAAFERLGRQVDDAREFEQPAIVDVFEAPGLRGAAEAA